MKKYSKEQLAASISDMITFEDCTRHVFAEEIFDFENCSAMVVGFAESREKLNGDTVLDYPYFDYIHLEFEDGDSATFNVDELREMETLVKLWN